MNPQRCETTQTMRYPVECQCGAIGSGIGPCVHWEPSRNPERCVYCDHVQACHHKAAAWLEQERLTPRSESAPIPAGWKLVPVELTEPMRISGYLYKPKLEARCLYRALLDAAPQVPSNQGSGTPTGVPSPAAAARDYSDKAWPFPTGRT